MADGCCVGPRGGKEYFDLLNHLFVQDSAIDEIDIIFCPKCKEEQEKEAIIVQEHKLGLRSWCIKPLYMYVYDRLMKQGRHKYDEIRTECLSVTDLSQLSRVVVLLTPECYTAWNIRKELVTTGMLSVDDDLQTSTLVLTKHPRSAETFSHRKWLINYYIKQKGKSQFCQEWLRKELSMCLQCAERYPDNYIVWSHRSWVVERFIESKKKLLSELHSMEKWVQMHISDHCGFHYRQMLIKNLKIFTSSSSDMALLCLSELQLVSNLLDAFPGHEAVWYHRRFIFYHWNLWFGSLSFDKLHEITLLVHEDTQDHQETEIPMHGSTSCWDPCVKSLGHLCRSAVVKIRPVGNKLQEDRSVLGRINMMLPSLESETKYCRGILRSCRGSEGEMQHSLAKSHIKWLTVLGGDDVTVVHREPALDISIQTQSCTS